MKRRNKGRGVFYTRDSGGRHENTPPEYVAWARRKAEEIGVTFEGTPSDIEAMIRDGQSAKTNLFLDYVVKGNTLSRNGLTALMEEAKRDSRITHVFIPRRDRLARPNHAVEGVQLENLLRAEGVTLVFMDKVCPPLERGKRQDVSDLICAVVDYDRSGKDLRDLAQKMIHAQIRRARMGFSTGGRAPYGFARWLVTEEGAAVRKLADGETVHLARHHVCWLPTREEQLSIIRRILKLLEIMPASRVAALLTKEGVPTPDAGRVRTDNGVRHATSGVWHQTTITSIARNPLLLAVATYGRRSMGEHMRYTPTGPRDLQDGDFRADEKPRIIRNRESDQIKAASAGAPVVDSERHRKLLESLDARGGTQRGKARSRTPDQNPLGARIFDMNCGWPMYRAKKDNNFRYGCGLYMQSHGASCNCNSIDGPTAARFVLGCLQQRLLSPTLMGKLRKRLEELVSQSRQPKIGDQKSAQLRVELSQIRADLSATAQNMARAKSDEQYSAIAEVFENLKCREAVLGQEIDALIAAEQHVYNPDDVVARAMSVAKRLSDVLALGNNMEVATKAIAAADAKLYLRFQPTKIKKRTVTKVVSGVVTFGAAEPPINVYQGPTGRRALAATTTVTWNSTGAGDNEIALPPRASVNSGEEGDLLGNVSRGDWI